MTINTSTLQNIGTTHWCKQKEPMGCASSMDHSVLPLIDDGDAMNVCSKLDKSKCLAGKFQRVNLPKEIWLSRMATFIHSLVKQIDNFNSEDYHVMIARLERYIKAIGHNPPKKDKHIHAVQVLETIFMNNAKPTPLKTSTIDQILINTSIDYCNSNKEHHFEEVMFIFTIIVNAPMMRYFETM